MPGNSQYALRGLGLAALGLAIAAAAVGASNGVAAAQAQAEPEPPEGAGKALYNQYCATCHMADGRGVPNFQPALVGSPIVNGSMENLEATIWAGSSFLGSLRENEFGTTMPPFGYLKAAEVKGIAKYVKDVFGDPDAEGDEKAPPGNVDAARL